MPYYFLKMDSKGNGENKSCPRSFSSGDEDVFNFPGVEDETSGSGPVSREAHAALREALKSIKKYLGEAKAQNAELKAKLKQREKRGSHSQVYQERDELQILLQKSYVAYKEKYEENEQLEKKVKELTEELRLSLEALAQGNGRTEPCSTSQEEGKSEHKKRRTIIEELKIMGLEVVEEKDQQFVILTDRDHLKKWLEDKSNGNISLVFKGCSLTDKATETEETATYKYPVEERRKLEAEIIFLRIKLQDQADELNRFYEAYKDAMEQNLKYREQQQRAKGEIVGKGVTPATQQTRTVTSDSLQRKAESVLIDVKHRVTEMKQFKDHLDKQNESLRTLIELSEKSTEDFLQLVSGRKPGGVRDFPQEGQLPEEAEREANPLSQRQRTCEANFHGESSDNAPLSIPVQESYVRRLINAEANVDPSGEGMNNQRLTGRDAEVSMTTAVSGSTWTGESDIEVIEEEDELVGATSAAGKLCPVCERFFPASYDQNKFERHVEQHFDEDS